MHCYPFSLPPQVSNTARTNPELYKDSIEMRRDRLGTACPE